MSKILWSQQTCGFYLAGVSSAIPDDARPISKARHDKLLAAVAKGHVLQADRQGNPVARPPAVTSRLDGVVAAIRSSARRRILAVASLEQQTNDNALIAMVALQIAAGGSASIDASEALARRRTIDTLRTRSNALEDQARAMTPAALTRFLPDDPDHWMTP